MIEWIDWTHVNRELEDVAYRQESLKAHFAEFARKVKEKVTSERFHIVGIGFGDHLDEHYFSTKFAGRTLIFHFESVMDAPGSLKGGVQCYLLRDLPEPATVRLGGFGFDFSGTTDIVVDGRAVELTYGNGPVLVVLNFIHRSLSLAGDGNQQTVGIESL